MTIRDTAITAIMTDEPTTIERSKPISEAYHLLRDAPFHHLVVTDGEAPVAMLATSDILRLVYDVDGAADDQALSAYIDHQFTIDDAMTADLKTVTVAGTVLDVATMLSDGALHSVVVLAADGSLAGIVTTTDLARHLCALLSRA